MTSEKQMKRPLSDRSAASLRRQRERLEEQREAIDDMLAAIETELEAREG
jgi:hypothetical protein